jgi:hypothetical protein
MRVLQFFLALARIVAPTLLQVVGLAFAVTGLYVLTPWLGFLALGICLAVIGWALDGDR